MKRKALGKGLSALLPEAPDSSGGMVEIDIKRIDPNPQQPRQRMEPSKLKELARSLQQEGVMQPVVVRKLGSRYQLITGERRWRAAQMAGLERVPAIVREVEDARLMELALIENIQREDLSPIEEAAAYRHLVNDLGLSQEQVADRVGKDRSTVANLLRLLRLPEPVRKSIAKQELSPGHARPLLMVPDATAQIQLAREIVENGLSVREVERRVKTYTKAKTAGKRAQRVARTDPNTREAEDKLRLALGTKVHIARKGRGGHLEISFYSEEELGRLYEILLRGARSKATTVGSNH